MLGWTGELWVQQEPSEPIGCDKTIYEEYYAIGRLSINSVEHQCRFLNYMNSFQLLKKNYEESIKIKNKKSETDSRLSSESNKAIRNTLNHQKHEANPYLLKRDSREVRTSKQSKKLLPSKRKSKAEVTRSLHIRK